MHALGARRACDVWAGTMPAASMASARYPQHRRANRCSPSSRKLLYCRLCAWCWQQLELRWRKGGKQGQRRLIPNDTQQLPVQHYSRAHISCLPSFVRAVSEAAHMASAHMLSGRLAPKSMQQGKHSESSQCWSNQKHGRFTYVVCIASATKIVALNIPDAYASSPPQSRRAVV